MKFQLIPIAAAAAMTATSCVIDEAYNFENIKDVDLTITVFQEGIEFPVGTTDNLTLKKLTGLSGSDLDFLTVNEDGFYEFNYSDEFLLSEEVEMLDMSEYATLDGISFDFSTDARILDLPDGEGYVLIDGDFALFEDSREIVIIPAEDIPDMMEHVSEILLEDVYLNCQLEVEGLPEPVNGYFYIDAVVQLPSCLYPSEFNVKGKLEQGRFAMDPVKIECIRDVDVCAGEDIVGTVVMKGKVAVASAEVLSSTVNDDMKASINARVGNADGNIALTSIRGRCAYDFEYGLSVDFMDVSELFRSESTCLDIVDAQIFFDVAGNIGVPLLGNIVITPWINGEPSEPTVELHDISLPYSYDPDKFEEIHLCVGSIEENCPDGRSFVEAPVSGMFRQIPDSLQISITTSMDSEKESLVFTDAKYDFNIAYEFSMPLEAGEEFEMSVADTLEVGSQVGDILKMGAVGLKIKTENTFALGLDLKLDVLDESGNVLAIVEEPIAVSVPAGNGCDSPAVVSMAEVVIKPIEGAAIDEIAMLGLTFTLASGEDTAALSQECYIKADIAAFLPEGITINLKGNKEDENE